MRVFRLALACVVLATSLSVVATPVAFAAAPPNDDLINATNIASFPVIGTTVYLQEATIESGEPEPSCAPGHLNNSVWYTYTPATTGFHRISVSGQSTDDSILNVYTASSLTTAMLGPVGCNDNNNLVHPMLRISLNAGVRYAIRISAYNLDGVASHLTLRASGPLLNDDLADAAPVTSLPFSVAPDAGAGSTEVGEPRPTCQTSGTLAGPTFWYAFTPTTTGIYRVDTEGYYSPVTVSLEVFEAPDLVYESLTSIACARSTIKAVAPLLTADVQYAIRVESGATAAPLNVRARSVQPINDHLSAARTIANLPFTESTDTHAATTEVGPPAETATSCSGVSNNSIWYSFTPLSTGLYRFDTIGSYRDLKAGAATVLDVFTAPTLDYPSISSIACDRYGGGPGSTTIVNLNLTGGTRYAIRIGSQDAGGLGVSILNVTQLPSVPVNDNIASAKLISSVPFSETLDTRGASAESGEPNQCTNSGINNSVWYSYTPTVSGNYQIDALGSSTESFVRYDVLEATSMAFGSLVSLGCGSNYGTSSGKLTLALTAGQQYAIRTAASSPGGHTAARLNVSGPLTAPANDLLANAATITTLPFRQPLDTSTAAKESGETLSPCSTGTQENHTIWYQFTPTITGNYDFMVANSIILLDVYTAPTSLTFANLTNIACINAFGSGGSIEARTTTETLTAGMRYVIRSASASTAGSGNSDFTLSLASAAPTIAVNNVTLEADDTGVRELVFAEIGSASDPEGTVDIACAPPIGTELAIGPHSVTCTATDDDGLETSDSGTVTIAADLTPPTISSAIAPSNFGTGWNNGTVTVTLTATDARSGIQSIYYKATGAQPISFTTVNAATASFQISSTGTTVVSFRARDDSGNLGSWFSRNVRIDTTRPSNTAPTATMGTRMNPDGTVPFTLAWTASDGQSGLAKTLLQIEANLGGFTPITLPSATAVSATVNLEDDTSYRFRTRSRDLAGNLSQVTGTNLWHTTGSFDLDVLQDNDTTGAVTYAGGVWRSPPATNWFGGTVHYATTVGSSVTINFTGTSMAWIGTFGPGRGRVSITLDGNPVRTAANPLDLYRATTSFRAVLYQFKGLSNTTHTVVITIVGKHQASSDSRIEFDGAVVRRPS